MSLLLTDSRKRNNNISSTEGGHTHSSPNSKERAPQNPSHRTMQKSCIHVHYINIYIMENLMQKLYKISYLFNTDVFKIPYLLILQEKRKRGYHGSNRHSRPATPTWVNRIKELNSIGIILVQCKQFQGTNFSESLDRSEVGKSTIQQKTHLNTGLPLFFHPKRKGKKNQRTSSKVHMYKKTYPYSSSQYVITL